jgi:hypothetical protein
MQASKRLVKILEGRLTKLPNTQVLARRLSKSIVRTLLSLEEREDPSRRLQVSIFEERVLNHFLERWTVPSPRKGPWLLDERVDIRLFLLEEVSEFRQAPQGYKLSV